MPRDEFDDMVPDSLWIDGPQPTEAEIAHDRLINTLCVCCQQRPRIKGDNLCQECIEQAYQELMKGL